MNISEKKDRYCHFCHVPLVPFTPFAHLKVDFCKICGWVWLDAYELGQLIGRKTDLPPVAHPVDPLPLKDLIECPGCEKKSLAPWTATGTSDGSAHVISFYRCAQCRGILIRLRDTGKIRSLFPPAVSQRDKNRFSAKSPAARVDLEGIFLSTPRFDFFAIPLACLLSIILEHFHLLQLVAWYVSMLFHEWSHAMMAWLSGFPALPLPFGFTFFTPERTSLVIFLCLVCWVYGLIYSFNRRSLPLGMLFFLLFCSQIYCSFFLSSDQSHSLVVAGGHGGEILFGSILLSAYHYPFPRHLRWDFWRFLALGAGVFVFNQSTLRWIQIDRGWRQISWASAMGDPQHSDLSRLREVWSWSQIDITDTYYFLSMVSVTWVVIHYVGFLCVKLKNRQH